MTPDQTQLVSAVAEGTVKGLTDSEVFKTALMPFCKAIGDGLGLWGLAIQERMKSTGDRAKQILADVGKEPEFISLKLFRPIILNAGLEEDDVLRENWAALLANAANPDHLITVHPSFPEILKQLSPLEAELANRIFVYVCNEMHAKSLPPISSSAPQVDFANPLHGDSLFAVASDRELWPMLENLETLGIIRTSEIGRIVTSQFHMTAFGFRFVRACRPPAKEGVKL